MSTTTMLHSNQFLPQNSYAFNPISQTNIISIKIRHPTFQFNAFHSRKSTITCARNRSTSKGLFGSQRSRKTLVQFVNFAASNLHYVLPEPFNFVIREFGNGVGGGGSGGGWKGFRWGGFNGGGGGGGGGRKRRADKKSQLWVLGVLAVLGFWGLIMGEDMNMKLGLKNDVLLLGAMCLSMFLVLIRNGCVPEWVLGFCSGGAIVGLLVNKKDEFKKLVKSCKKMGIARYMKIK